MLSMDRVLYDLSDMPVGVDRRIVCPQCSGNRRKKANKDLSIRRVEDGIVYKCWHCGLEGKMNPEPPAYIKKGRPKAIEKQPEHLPLTSEALDFLSDRGISEETAKKCGVYSTEFYSAKAKARVQAIGFPYTNHGETYASKLRALPLKDHLQKGACQTFWLADKLGELDRIYITEGELDAMAMIEAGIGNVISVPNGAPASGLRLASSQTKEDDRKFGYLWALSSVLDQVEEVVICVDADEPGEVLSNELSRRIGKQKIWLVQWPSGCKDANDTLLRYGPDGVRDAVDSAARMPVAGLYEADTFYRDIETLYTHGATKGHSTGLFSVDNIFTVMPGTLNVVTGVPSSGKSELLDQFMVNLCEADDNYRVAFASFENEPSVHIAKLMQKRVGKHFFVGPYERMTKDEVEESRRWVRDRFYFVYQADGSMATVEDILSRLSVAVARHGITAAVIDPMNYIMADSDKSETQWVSYALTQFRVWAQAHDVSLFLVAHPAKLHRGDQGRVPVPKGYDISGSAHYINKADFGLTVHREEDEPGIVQVHNWKTRFGWAGRIGKTFINYDHRTTRYRDPDPDV